MLSRRSVRIKVMQLLYAKGRDEALTPPLALRHYDLHVNKIHQQYLLSLATLIKVALHAVSDFNMRRSKHLPTPEDLSFTIRIWDNPVLKSLTEDKNFKKLLDQFHLMGRIDEDQVFSLYQELLKHSDYMKYACNPAPVEADDRQMLVQLYKLIVAHNVVEELMENVSLFWQEDKSLVLGAGKKTVKALPDTTEIYLSWNEEDQLTYDFGKDLLGHILKNETDLLELIKPKLQNWDADRLADLDLILIQMALAELLYFPTIPPKVSINEYVELTKLYSSDKSREFVNGILDQLMKQLKESGQLQKMGRGLID